MLSRILILLSFIVFCSCQNPLDTNSNIDKKVIDGKVFPYYFLNDSIDYRLCHPNEEYFLKNMIISNADSTVMIISKNSFQNSHFFIIDSLPYTLKKIGDNGDRKEISIQFKYELAGIYIDSLYFNNNKLPFFKCKAFVPEIYAKDVNLDSIEYKETASILTIYNNSNRFLKVNNIRFYNHDIDFGADYSFPIEIYPNKDTSLKIVLKPTKKGLYETKIGIFSNQSKLVDTLAIIKAFFK